MSRKYISPLTSQLTPDNWKEKINLKEMSLDDMTDLLSDMRKMESFGKKIGGYMKEAIMGRRSKDSPVFKTRHFSVEIEHVERKAGLDEAKILEEMGEEWVEAHRKPPIEYDQLKLQPLEGVGKLPMGKADE